MLGYALAKPAREVLFTVVPREDMYKAKICIDTLVVRAGDMFAAALFHFIDGRYHLGMTPFSLRKQKQLVLWKLWALQLSLRLETLVEQLFQVEVIGPICCCLYLYPG